MQKPHNWVVPFALARVLLIAEAERILEEEV
jgi:hypothetical protein